MPPQSLSRPSTLALLSFSLATVPRQARGSSNPSTGSTNTGSSTTSATDVTSTTSGLTIAVTSAIVLIALIASHDGTDATASSHARALLDAGMLAGRGDLGVELALIVRSPQAFDQLSDELARGSGPGLDALVRATGLSPGSLARHWKNSCEQSGLIVDTDGAMRLAMDFAARITPEIAIASGDKALLLWQLQRERLDPSVGAHKSTHAWLARWLGVTPEAAMQATEAALRPLDGRSEASARADLATHADALLDAIARDLAARHPTEVRAKVASLVAQATPFLPTSLAPTVAALSET